MKHRCKYEFSAGHGYPRHVWTCVGRHGAVHFHVTDMGDEWEKQGHERYSGGLEVHYRSPPDYMADNAPSQDKCWLLGCPCWHDGTSLYASETLVPMWRVAPDDHKRMFEIMVREYESQFAKLSTSD